MVAIFIWLNITTFSVSQCFKIISVIYLDEDINKIQWGRHCYFLIFLETLFPAYLIPSQKWVLQELFFFHFLCLFGHLWRCGSALLEDNVHSKWPFHLKSVSVALDNRKMPWRSLSIKLAHRKCDYNISEMTINF